MAPITTPHTARTALAFAAALAAPGAMADPHDHEGHRHTEHGAIDFEIVDGSVVPASEFATKVTILGCSWGTASGRLGSITVQLNVGDEVIEPFGRATNRTAADINRGVLDPISLIVDRTFSADSPVTITARAWEANYPWWSPYRLNSHYDAGRAVLVLRDGDPVPRYTTTAVQIPIEVYLDGFTDNAGEHLMLDENQAIYLFEFNDPRWSPPIFIDYQDLVVLITLGESPEDLEDQPIVPPSTVAPLFD